MFKSCFASFIIQASFIFLFASCVGTVEDTRALQSEYLDPFYSGFHYSGIVRANAIAHDKIEIEFEEVFDADTYLYYLHVNEDEPVKLSLESLGTGRIGYKKYTIRNLSPNTQYKLRVSVEDPKGQSSINENVVLVTTFDNKVANFDGVVGVEALTGKAHNSVKVSWVPTPMQGTFESDPFDPKFYEITYMPVTSGLENLNMTGAPGRQTIRVGANPFNNPSSVVISSLTPDTAYFFQVRAIHALYADQEEANQSEGTPITVNRELNTTWIQYKTAPDDGLYDFNQGSISVKNSLGQAGLTTVRVFWEPPEGIFENYRVFYREYVVGVDGTDAQLDDELSKEVIQGYIDAGDTSHYKNVDVSATFLDVSGLTAYKWYQFKVVPCKTAICKVDPDTDLDASAISEMRAIRVEPFLAPFFGINFIRNPKEALHPERITIEFDPPALSLGFANKLKVYCLDAAMSSYVEIGQTPVSTTVGNCNGLKYNETINFASTTKITVEPVNNIDTSSPEDASYCFAMVPAIEGAGYETREPPREDWVVRCIQPDIVTPTMEEFPGIEGSCQVNQDQAKVDWIAPTGGIYNRFAVFARKKVNPSDMFSFHDVISKVGVNDGEYLNVVKTDSEFTHTFADLEPGATYLVGALALTDGGTPGDYTDDIYSEYNLNVVECKIPYPRATFVEWTRAFAIGPRSDGRVPQTGPNGQLEEEAFLFEALTSEGIPYEVDVTGDYTMGFSVNTGGGNYQLSPGNFEPSPPSSFSSLFDGLGENGLAASRTGIVSIAWRDVLLSFSEDDFQTAQDHALRSTREYGYRVYRSDDNKQSWKELTEVSGLIHAGDYSYQVRANEAPVTERMGFFTDYSVKSMTETSAGLERARVYWYKVVPVFGGTELAFEGETETNFDGLIKVTLPPPNMALVHRKMANRNICTEMDLATDKSNHYRCDYNGLGSNKKSSPWRAGESVYDFGGDLLVDRNELGCNFTRGSSVTNPQYAASYYDRPGTSLDGYTSEVGDFTGYSTDGAGGDNLIFKGCTLGMGRTAALRTLDAMLPLADGDPWDASLLGPDYRGDQFDKLVYGDCLYDTDLAIHKENCVEPAKMWTAKVGYPGFPAGETTAYDCDSDFPTLPQYLNGDNSTKVGLADENFINEVTIQAEHMAVIYNRAHPRGEVVSPYGPSGKIINTNGNNSFYQSCYINLAAIGSNPASGNAKWYSRWAPVNLLFEVKSDNGYESYLDKTVNQTHADTALYQSDPSQDYRVPQQFFWNVQRFDGDTKLGKIFSSNSAKLPPLTGFSRQEGQRLCSTYEVQVGFSGDDASFAPLAQPKRKRLMRKNEFIAAAAHPDQRIEGGATNADPNTIWNIESGNGAGACVGGGRITPDNNIGFTAGGGQRDINTQLGISADTETFLWTGSSSRSSAMHSSKCVSRYGIQDLIGNLGELTGEVLFCDYSLDTLYYGVNGVASQSIVLDGYKDPADKSTYTRLYPRESGRYLWENARIIAPGPDGAMGTADDVVNNDPEIWVDGDPNSGYCSLVDDDSSRVANTLNFRAPSGAFEPVFDFTGNVNTEMITRENPEDQESVDGLRNGDGLYLNFGPTNLLPKMADYDNTLALVERDITDFDENVHRIGKFFNPVVGLPLMCETSNGDTCGTYADDNRRITTSELKDPLESTYVLDNFPIGYSQINHFSLGTHRDDSRVFTASQAANSPGVNVIMDFFVEGADLTTDLNLRSVSGYQEKTAEQMTIDGDLGGDLWVEKKEFNIERHARIQFSNGGDFKSDINGRYGMKMNSENTNLVWQSNDNSRGVRCAVKINE